MKELNPALRRDLRAQAHSLKPTVTIAGNGLTPAVLAEIERSLQAHELIKIKAQGIERAGREALMQTLCAELDAAPIQQIGNILIVWRERREETSTAATAAKAKAAPRPSTAKSAAAFAAAARRAALARASSQAAPKRPASSSSHAVRERRSKSR